MKSFWDSVRHRGPAFLCVICFVLFGTACQTAPDVPAPPAEPVLVFSERLVAWETETESFRGLLSCDMQQISLTFTEPEELEGLKLLSANTLQYQSLSAEVPGLPGPAGRLLEILEVAVSSESLTQTDAGFSGALSDGTAFLLTTDGTGALRSVTVSGEKFVFEEPSPDGKEGSS